MFDSEFQRQTDDARAMQNLGYFQLAANPGMHGIKLLNEKEMKLVSNPYVSVDSFLTPDIFDLKSFAAENSAVQMFRLQKI